MNQSNLRFDNGTQVLIGLFALFIALPVFDVPIVGVSVTFPIFLALLLRARGQGSLGLLKIKKNPLDIAVVAYFALASLSILLAPEADAGEEVLWMADIKNLFYLAYWYVVYAFFRSNFSRIDFYLLSKFALIGTLLLVSLAAFGDDGHGYFSLGAVTVTHNSFAFNTVLLVGVATVFLVRRYGPKSLPFMLALVMYAILRADSRAGAVIMFALVPLLLLFGFWHSTPKYRRAFSLLCLLLAAPLIGFMFTDVDSEDSVLISIGEAVEGVSPEVAATLINREAQLERDKSVLIRRVQVEKALDLFDRYPYLGIGWGRFKNFRGNVDISQYLYLSDDYDSYALTRSSHNSYMQVLAEVGLFGFASFCLINLYVLLALCRYMLVGRASLISGALAVSLCGAAVYFLAISAVTGAGWYFVLGLFAGAAGSTAKLEVDGGLKPGIAGYGHVRHK